MLDNTVGWFVGYTGKTVTAVNIFHVDPKNGQLLSLEGLGGAAKSVPESTDPMRIWTAYTRATTG